MHDDVVSAGAPASFPSPRNDTARLYPRDVCIHELFEAGARNNPHSRAVVFHEQKITYERLNARSNQLARYLRRRGVGPEVLVGLCLERGVDMVVGVLGILKAGGAYVPLDPAYPKERIGYIMEDARARVLVTQQALLAGLPEQEAEIVSMDQDWPSIAEEETSNCGYAVAADNLAYVIYTSGSTGQPKGVQVEHRSVVNFLYSMRHEPGLEPSDVMAAVTTLCFDIAGLEIYLPLITGATVALISRDEASDGRKLQACMRQCGASVMQGTPATWRLLLEAGWPGDKNLKILCGGEALPRELANKLLPRCRSLWNMYGPTETTIWSAVYRVTGANTTTVPIGYPIANTQFYIVDGDLHPLAPGRDGQLLIGGDGLARGYKNRPDLTEEKFIVGRCPAAPGARLYQTGDLVRYLPDGTVAFLGRMDHQVKIRGYRVEPGEIESILASHPSVRQCVVVAHAEGGDKKLVAYLVTRPDQQISGRSLREFLKATLPDYMIPSAFVVLHTLPLTPNGKIDRAALPAPTRKNCAIERDVVPPRDDLERELVNIWEEVLAISPIGITDNIFELGITSLVAVRLFARIEKVLGRDLPPGPLFQAPTVQELARLLRGKEAPARRRTSLVAIQPNGSKTPLFCVHGGAGTVILFHALARRLVPERPVYGLQSQGLYGRDLPHTTVEEMAAHYVNEIRMVQPQGPYLLAGWCFGGMVAFEMAQQLHRIGEQVDMLATLLARSSADYRRVFTPLRPTSSSARIRAHWSSLAALPAREKIEYLEQKILGHLGTKTRNLREGTLLFGSRIVDAARRSLYRFYLRRRQPLPAWLRNTYFLHTTTAAERCYRAQPYPGSMLVFRDDRAYPDPNLGWGRFVQGDIESHEIALRESRNRALVEEPAVAIVAEKIEEYLSRKFDSGAGQRNNPAPGIASSGPALETHVLQ